MSRVCTERIVGLDVGGTGLRALLCDSTGKIVCRHYMSTEAESGFEAVMDRIFQLVVRTASSDLLGQAPIEGIGMALAGNLRSQEGICVFSPNLPGWRNVNVGARLTERFGAPVRMGNDANCAALAEHRFGAGRGATNMVMLTLGTGIGGGIIIDGRLSVGPREGMGELGHVIVDPSGPECGCGNHGCLEAICGAAGIASVARLRLQAGAKSIMLDIAGGDILAITPRVVAEAAAQGDGLASEILAYIGNTLGVAITSIIMVVDPDRVVIGGQIAGAGDPLLEPLRRTVAARARMVPFDVSNIVVAELGPDAGALGAIALFA